MIDTTVASTPPLVAVGALGGTISMTTDDDGGAAMPTQGAATQISAARERGIRVKARDIALVGSPSMTIATLLEALDFARTAVDQGAAGVVLTHGTDTMAESAYLLSLLWDREEPLVFTGSMRPSDVPGADGPGNLAAAVRVAADPAMRATGVLVCFADLVHAATLCEKTDSTLVNAFSSPGWGPIARVDVEAVTRVMTPGYAFEPLPAPDPTMPVHIPIVTAALDDDGFAIRAMASAGAEAVVIAGAGAGRLSARAAEAAKTLVAQGTTVAFTRKTVHGVTTLGSYAYPGSEADLIAGGLLPAGLLSAEKTRLLLHVLLQAGYTGPRLAAELRRRCLA